MNKELREYMGKILEITVPSDYEPPTLAERWYVEGQIEIAKSKGKSFKNNQELFDFSEEIRSKKKLRIKKK